MPKTDHQKEFEEAAKVWGEALKHRLSGVKRGQGRVLRAWALQLLRLIILKSPVRTGRSRAGWFAAYEALGGKAPGTATAKGGIRGGKKRAGLEDAVTEGRAQGSVEIKDGLITIVNAVKYIVPLEFGHSKQAPFGMVRISMREMALGKTSLPAVVRNFYRSAFTKEGKMGELRAH